MIISRVMTKNPIFIHPHFSVNDARGVMDKEKISHLPVLDKNDTLVGLVTRKDLIKAGPSPATTLDIYEISYLLSRLKVEMIMERHLVTVDEHEVVEEAARTMVDKGIGCLLVMRGSLLVGIITDTDLFRVFINAFGARHPGVRLVFNISEKPGQLAKIAGAIAERNGNIASFASSEGDDLAHRRGTLRITGLSRSEVEAALKDIPGLELEDIRNVV
ncbi:MAG: CBS domain-containing protein [Spirochaetaceae bacterium]|nr:CBS domain-containing protein [Spirochaetaceae bacterium]